MQAWVDVALLTKTKTRIGGFVVQCTTGLSFFLEPGMELFFVPPRIDCPRSARIVEVENVRDMTATVTFDSFENMQQMLDLVGSHCLLDERLLTPEVLDAAGIRFVGMAVVDEALGKLGTVVDIIANPGQNLLIVDCPSYGKSDVMIPCVDEFIVDVDEEEGVIRTSIPAGLLKL